MAESVKDPSRQAPVRSTHGLSLSVLERRLGTRAAQVFFNRIDSAQRQGTMIIGTSIRDARGGLGKAHRAGRALLVCDRRAGRHGKRSADPFDGLVIIKLDDLAAVVRAGQEEFDWATAFAPRSGLEAAATSPAVKPGSRGHRQLRA